MMGGTVTALAGLAAGVLLAAALVALARRRGHAGERRIYAAALVIAALVYLVAGGLSGDPGALGMESAGFLGFSVLALLGATAHPAWLAAGWALHAGWDGLRQLGDPAVLPAWYAWLCLGFDLVVAAAALRTRPR